MAEASMAAFGSAIGVAIALAVVCFVLRARGHAQGTHDHTPDLNS